MPKRCDNRVWIVLAAAFALLVQSSFGIAAPLALRPPGLTADSFGNPLCLGGGHGDNPARHAPARDCCTMGCGSAATTISGQCQVPPRLGRTIAPVPLAPADPALKVPARKYRPGNPRAPPGLA